MCKSLHAANVDDSRASRSRMPTECGGLCGDLVLGDSWCLVLNRSVGFCVVSQLLGLGAHGSQLRVLVLVHGGICGSLFLFLLWYWRPMFDPDV